jgi:hypothetical protein
LWFLVEFRFDVLLLIWCLRACRAPERHLGVPEQRAQAAHHPVMGVPRDGEGRAGESKFHLGQSEVWGRRHHWQSRHRYGLTVHDLPISSPFHFQRLSWRIFRLSLEEFS